MTLRSLGWHALCVTRSRRLQANPTKGSEMKMRIVKTSRTVFFAGMLGIAMSANALTFSFSNIFSGGGPPDPATWLTATFADAGANTVSLSMTASGPFVDGHGNTIKIDNVLFNL